MWWSRTLILAHETWRREEQQVTVILGYIVNLRVAWAT